uniref:endonuclease domain-containing protein n=1 Tax=Trichocoleus desertorum TaxID=1481672 RepID=UPI0025B3396F|nr:DUF559 domain-containing protein [Trichocoleus desertorum]
MNKTTPRIRGTTPEIESAAKRLRYHLTPAEQLLWQALKGKQLYGLKFRCQHPVGPFIADFLCAKHKLIIELDGAVHDQQTEYDGARTQKLNEFGYRVIRFRNQEVFANLDAVLEQVLEAISAIPEN